MLPVTIASVMEECKQIRDKMVAMLGWMSVNRSLGSLNAAKCLIPQNIPEDSPHKGELRDSSSMHSDDFSKSKIQYRGYAKQRNDQRSAKHHCSGRPEQTVLHLHSLPQHCKQGPTDLCNEDKEIVVRASGREIPVQRSRSLYTYNSQNSSECPYVCHVLLQIHSQKNGNRHWSRGVQEDTVSRNREFDSAQIQPQDQCDSDKSQQGNLQPH